MRRRPQLAVALSLVAVGCTALLVFAGHRPAAAMLQGAGSSGSARAPLQPSNGSPPPAGRFTIAGDVGGLYPGASRPLVLLVANPQHFAIVVTSIETTVGDPSQTCPGSDLAVASFSGQATVPAGGTAVVTVGVTLSHSAPDACQDAIFPLTYQGLARKA